MIRPEAGSQLFRFKTSWTFAGAKGISRQEGRFARGQSQLEFPDALRSLSPFVPR